MAAKLFIQDRVSPLQKLFFWRQLKFLNALTGSATWDPASVAAGAATANTTITVAGAKTSDKVYAKFSNALPPGAYLISSVTSANTVSVKLQNNTASTLDLASGTLSVRVEDRATDGH